MALDKMNSNSVSITEEDEKEFEEITKDSYYSSNMVKQILGQNGNDSRPFTAEEEKYYTTEYANNKDVSTRNIIFNHNTRLVCAMARKYANGNMDYFTDYFQEGCIGLMKAIDNFKPEMGYRFSTYACWWIKQSITRYMYNCNDTIRLPVHVNEERYAIKKIRREAERDGIDIDYDTLEEKTGIPKNKIMQLDSIGNIVSLDTTIKSGDDDNSVLGDFIGDTSTDIEREAVLSDVRSIIFDLFDYLKFDDRTRDVILKRFGFYDNKCWTLQELGDFYNCSRERIRQVESKALRRMRHASSRRFFKDYEEGI